LQQRQLPAWKGTEQMVLTVVVEQQQQQQLMKVRVLM
jgi:hypothetical protein